MMYNYKTNHDGETPFRHIILRTAKDQPSFYTNERFRIVQDDWEDSAITRYSDQAWSVSHLLRELDYAKHKNWDSEGAVPVAPESFAAARDILLDLKNLGLPEPDVEPSADGALCMEWIWGTTEKVFLDIGPGTQVLVFAKTRTSVHEQHFDRYDSTAKACIFNLFDQITEHLDN